jgi:hypothetical protein
MMQKIITNIATDEVLLVRSLKQLAVGCRDRLRKRTGREYANTKALKNEH